jgi:hypothetical protein
MCGKIRASTFKSTARAANDAALIETVCAGKTCNPEPGCQANNVARPSVRCSDAMPSSWSVTGPLPAQAWPRPQPGSASVGGSQIQLAVISKVCCGPGPRPPDRHHGWCLRRRGSRDGHHGWPVADGVRGARQRVLTPDVEAGSQHGARVTRYQEDRQPSYGG